MAFMGDNGSNLPRPEDVKRCKFGGDNNRRATGGCGKHVEKTGQMVRSKSQGTSWFIWYHFNFCEDHWDLQEEYKNKIVPTLEVA
tara:strand:- start:7925 stop:8179 length:255 start_codon:yes stop_codon:yes gene_type:complete